MKTFYGKRNSIQVDPVEISKVLPKFPIERGKTLDTKLHSAGHDFRDCLHRKAVCDKATHQNTNNCFHPIKSIRRNYFT